MPYSATQIELDRIPSYERAVLSVFPPDRALSIPEIHAKFLSLRQYSGHTVRKALVNLTRAGLLNRVAHGRYALPTFSPDVKNLRRWSLSFVSRNPDLALRPKDLATAWRREMGFPLPLELFEIELKLLARGGPVRELRFMVYQYWPNHTDIFEE